MNPDTRFAASLVLSLAMMAPQLMAVTRGDADILDVGLRYVVSFVVTFLVVGVIGRLYNGYLLATAASASSANGAALAGPSVEAGTDSMTDGADPGPELPRRRADD